MRLMAKNVGDIQKMLYAVLRRNAPEDVEDLTVRRCESACAFEVHWLKGEVSYEALIDYESVMRAFHNREADLWASMEWIEAERLGPPEPAG